MGVLFVFILSMKFVSFVQSAEKIPCLWCAYGGSMVNSSYKFSVSDIPDRCEAIVYGSEYFDTEPSAADTSAITALNAANKIVYMFYTNSMNVDWPGVMNSKDPNVLNQQIATMIQFLNKNKVNGVILSYLQLLAGVVPEYAPKIKSLICTIKSEVPSIKVGLLVSGYMASEYKNTELFDFTVTNEVVDLYVIDTTITGNNCTADTMANGGRFPITSTDKNVVTIDQVSKDSKNSPMDQSKVIIYFGDYASKMENGIETGKPYTEFCQRTGSGIWCGDTMQMFYDNVKHVKDNFKGILIGDLDQDDFDNTCGCGKFPVANTYMDAWLNKPITCCAKI